jgi:uncharacterized phiE125 gp8 family phage protein
MSSLTLVTAPGPEPLTTDQAKLHLRVDWDHENTLIDTLVTAARQWVETFTRRALMTQTWDYRLCSFPCDGAPIELPLPPVSAITSVSYVDTAGATQVWSASLYDTDLPAGPLAQKARILPKYGEIYPYTRAGLNPVTVRLVAGYGGTVKDVPDVFILAIKMLVEHWYTHRSPVTVGNSVAMPIPMSVESLLWSYKVF